MNRFIAMSVLATLLIFGPTSASGQAKQLSPERLDMLDQMGYFSPGFKAAVHDLVNNKDALEQANAEKTKLTQELPDLQNQAMAAEAKTVVLRQELARYAHPEETDFVTLQWRMNDTNSKLEEQIAQAQAYVWAYPSSPHESDAQQYLQQVQKKLADQQQAEKEAEAARAAARAKLVQRAQARDLSIGEWRDFLRDMSQDDLVKLLGRPTSQKDDYWTYAGEWIVDPATKLKVGMEINFNAGRVITVDEKPASP
jgi:peptidoglycan hydrolase CwlO-like protein